MKVHKLNVVSLILIMCLLSFTCNKPVGKSQNDKLVHYKNKFRLAYAHFKHPKDSLKFKALNYIISNLPYQYHTTSITLAKYDSVLLTNQNRDEGYLKRKLDSLTLIYGNNINLVSDSKVITNTYLINNIDAAFKSWEYKWGGTKLSFTDFCEYILPYKLENEKPEYWRDSLINLYKWVHNSLDSQNNLFNNVEVINKQSKAFNFTSGYDYPIDIGYKLMRLVGVGSCASASKLVAYPMRAMGMPVVIDYAYWGNRNIGHFWNAIIFKNKPYPFDPIETKVGSFKIQFVGVNKLARKPPKIFRKMFSVQQNSLPFQNLSKEVIPNNLKVKDVTAEYIRVSNISLNLGGKPTNNKFAYLCTFNNLHWQPIWWGNIFDGKVQFKNMGRDMVYMPCIIENSELNFIGNPLVLHKNGVIIELNANLHTKLIIPIDKKYPDDLSNEIEIGDKYQLLYWLDGWQSLGIQTATQKIIYFKNAPSNALFWIRDLTKGKQERIFTYKNNKIQWW